MSKLSQQDLNKLRTLVKKLDISDPIKQALVNDANQGIALSGATGKFQQTLYRQAKALSHIEQALSILDEDKSAQHDFGSNTLRSIETEKYYSLVLQEVPKDKKIAILKVVRSLTGFGLKESIEIVESTPYPLFDRLLPRKAAQFVTQLETAGATVEINPDRI